MQYEEQAQKPAFCFEKTFSYIKSEKLKWYDIPIKGNHTTFTGGITNEIAWKRYYEAGTL